MANTNRLAKRYLAELVDDEEQLHKVGLEPLIRYLEANAPLAERVGYSISPKQDFARFGQTPLLHFYPAAFTDVKFSKTTGVYKLNNSYWGMLGINGPLPSHLTEYAIERNYRLRDNTFTSFLNIFNHRFISLFYRSWADAEPTVSHDRPDKDYFSYKMKALSGDTNIKPAAHSPEHTTNDYSKIKQYAAGLLTQKNRSAKTLTQVLSEYLKHEITISEFQGNWYPLTQKEQTSLGQYNNSLGATAIIGTRTYQRNFNFTINIGPLSFQQYTDLLQNQARLHDIASLTRHVVGQEFEFSINLILDKYQTRACQLGVSQLGINSWCQDKSTHLQQQDPIMVYRKAC